MRTLILSLAAISIAAATPPARAHAQDHDHGHADIERLGRVNFPAGCKDSAHVIFERGVAMLHSFWFEEANRAFEEALRVDAACAMAHWGVAMTMLGNPFTATPPSAERLRAGFVAGSRAVALTPGKTPREHAYAQAALALHQNAERVGYRDRMLAHERAMRRVYEENPDDPEAAIFYARAIIANAPPDDLTYARLREASAILEPLFEHHPDHPGLAHYIIHANDAPSIAHRALSAARRYAGIAPAAPHALHMPSHIFTRLGYWDESIETNRRSAAAEPDSNAAVHPMDYMVYAYLQQGRDREARAVVDRATSNVDRFYGGTLGYNFAAMQARYALERGRWDEAARLPVPRSAFGYVEAIPRFARAVGAARSGQTAVARAEVAALAALRDSLDARGEAYWAVVVSAQRLAAESWLRWAEGDTTRALELARQAADLEETVEKHPVTPGPLLPARELEGDMLLELRRPAEALQAYEKTLTREPNRARTLYGAARSAELAGNDDVARRYYRDLAELMSRADQDRLEARAARSFLLR